MLRYSRSKEYASDDEEEWLPITVTTPKSEDVNSGTKKDDSERGSPVKEDTDEKEKNPMNKDKTSADNKDLASTISSAIIALAIGFTTFVNVTMTMFYHTSVVAIACFSYMLTLGNSQQDCNSTASSASYSRAVELCQTPVGEGENVFSKKNDSSQDERLPISNNSSPGSTEEESFSSSADMV